jgi:hypothetical protein
VKEEHVRRTLATFAIGVALLAGAPARAADTVVFAGAGSYIAGWTTPVAALVKDTTGLTFVNADAALHDVVARVTVDAQYRCITGCGPDTRAWCIEYPIGRCPVFWTPLVGIGRVVPVQGLENTTPGQFYTYICTIHSAMVGTLYVLDMP